MSKKRKQIADRLKREVAALYRRYAQQLMHEGKRLEPARHEARTTAQS
jgi:hypothetical protein